MEELEEVLKEWDEKRSYGSCEDRLKRAKKWDKYYTYLAEKQKGVMYHHTKAGRDTALFLKREGIIDSNTSLLDIGGGTGSFTLEIAKLAGFVDVLEPNAQSREVLKERAEFLGLDNIRTESAHWEQFEASKKYDVTFTSMCPSICNKEDILKLEDMTNKTCCIVTVGMGSRDKIRKELLESLNIRNFPGMMTDALTYYRVLYLMGRKVNVKTFSYRSKTTSDVDDLIEKFAVYLKIFGLGEKDTVPYMKEYFKHKYPDNTAEDESIMNYNLIYWDK